MQSFEHDEKFNKTYRILDEFFSDEYKYNVTLENDKDLQDPHEFYGFNGYRKVVFDSVFPEKKVAQEDTKDR